MNALIDSIHLIAKLPNLSKINPDVVFNKIADFQFEGLVKKVILPTFELKVSFIKDSNPHIEF